MSAPSGLWRERPRRVSYPVLLGLYGVNAAVLLAAQTGQIGEANEYMGMQPWHMDLPGYLLLLGGLPLLAWFNRRGVQGPSDFFRLFYCNIVLLSFLVLHPVAGPLPASTVYRGAAALFAPMVALAWLGRAIPPLRVYGPIKPEWSGIMGILLVVAVMLGVAVIAPDSAGFGIDDSHVRRLEGRSVYQAGSLLSYGLAMAMNGFTPYLAFVAGWRKRFAPLAVAILAVVFYYWLLGVKAPILYVLAAMLLGIAVRRGRVQSVPLYFLLSVLGLGVVMLCEWVSFDGYSMVADYLFRRVFSAPAEIQSYYLQFLSDKKQIDWSWLQGIGDPEYSITYFIGSNYFDNPDSNVNTNAFLHALAASGMLGYCYTLIVVPLVFGVFDRLYQGSRNPGYLFIGYLYGLLLVEQAYSVALLSSGVALLSLMIMLERPDKATRSARSSNPISQVIP